MTASAITLPSPTLQRTLTLLNVVALSGALMGQALADDRIAMTFVGLAFLVAPPLLTTPSELTFDATGLQAKRWFGRRFWTWAQIRDLTTDSDSAHGNGSVQVRISRFQMWTGTPPTSSTPADWRQITEQLTSWSHQGGSHSDEVEQEASR